jgi:hypothetical protein
MNPSLSVEAFSMSKQDCVVGLGFVVFLTTGLWV